MQYVLLGLTLVLELGLATPLIIHIALSSVSVNPEPNAKMT